MSDEVIADFVANLLAQRLVNVYRELCQMESILKVLDGHADAEPESVRVLDAVRELAAAIMAVADAGRRKMEEGKG